MQQNNKTRKIDDQQVRESVQLIREKVNSAVSTEKYIQLFSCIDLTSLNTADNEEKINMLAKKVSDFKLHFPNLNNVAAICVFPSMVSTTRDNLKDPDVKIASVSACFPSSQTFISVKTAECDLCIKKGADELDIVISVGDFLAGRYTKVAGEINIIKKTIGDKKLKVILETGELHNLNNIYQASVLAMEAGADFIKTSTGKTTVSATPESVYTMCLAIKDYYNKTGKMIGIKPAGGMGIPQDALLHLLIVEHILGEQWLNYKYFRLGTSKLANLLLSEISDSELAPTYFDIGQKY
jgi:deoxyribose-phosphate aldolase